MKLKLVGKKQETPTIYSFIFKPDGLFTHAPGQFMRLAIPHNNPDNRGVTRNYSIASSSTEDFVMIATRFIENGSSFKKALLKLEEGDEIEAVGPFGRFTLPQDKSDCIFVTGGIGITPVRSMIKFATDKKLPNRLVVLFSNRTADEIPFKDFLDKLDLENPNLEIIHTISRPEAGKESWNGRVGRIDEKLVSEKITNIDETFFYLCGPTGLIQAFYDLLISMRISQDKIKRENFPGYDRYILPRR